MILLFDLINLELYVAEKQVLKDLDLNWGMNMVEKHSF